MTYPLLIIYLIIKELEANEMSRLKSIWCILKSLSSLFFLNQAMMYIDNSFAEFINYNFFLTYIFSRSLQRNKKVSSKTKLGNPVSVKKYLFVVLMNRPLPSFKIAKSIGRKIEYVEKNMLVSYVCTNNILLIFQPYNDYSIVLQSNICHNSRNLNSS